MPHLTQKQLAEALGVSDRMVRKYLESGMPQDSVQDALTWRSENLKASSRRRVALPALQIDRVDVSGETLDDSVDRLRKTEKALGIALQREIESGQPDVIATLRKEHTAAVKALTDAEYRIMKIKRERGQLVSMDEAKAIISRSLASVTSFFRRLDEGTTDENEKAKLKAIAEAGLSEIRHVADEE
jgi:DNA-binding transcriptional regulator LsrR (DeoR family)